MPTNPSDKFSLVFLFLLLSVSNEFFQVACAGLLKIVMKIKCVILCEDHSIFFLLENYTNISS